LLSELAPTCATLLKQIQHENIGTISLVYRDEDIPAEPIINGLMIPRREKRAIDAVTISSRKMPQRSHPGYTLLRVFFGGAQPELVTYDDEKLLAAVRAELRDLLNIQAEPLAHDLYRWPAGFPQAEVGHLERIDAIEASLPAGIFLAGSSYRGIAVPDCIKQGREAAKKVIFDIRD
jgi:protoporphyrinogen/coproporphyrinogen III oxidase